MSSLGQLHCKLQCRTAWHRAGRPKPLHAVQVIRLLGLADAHVKRRVAELQASLKTHELERVQVSPPDRLQVGLACCTGTISSTGQQRECACLLTTTLRLRALFQAAKQPMPSPCANPSWGRALTAGFRSSMCSVA